jgi:hypothetical protein
MNQKKVIMKKIIINVLTLGLVICLAMHGYAQMPVKNNQSILFASDDSKLAKETSSISLADQKDADDNYDGTPSVILGFRYMPTFTSLSYTHTEGGALSTTMVLGHGFGGLLGVNFSDNVGLQAEVIYSALAQKFAVNNVEHEVKLSYINVPLMLVLNTGYSRPVNFNICAGPQVGINTGSKLTASGTHEGDTLQAVLAVKPADLGIAYGAGLDFGPPNFKISIGFRGVYGLIDVSDQSQSITTNQYYVLQRSHVKTYAGYIGVAFGF